MTNKEFWRNNIPNKITDKKARNHIIWKLLIFLFLTCNFIITVMQNWLVEKTPSLVELLLVNRLFLIFIGSVGILFLCYIISVIIRWGLQKPIKKRGAKIWSLFMGVIEMFGMYLICHQNIVLSGLPYHIILVCYAVLLIDILLYFACISMLKLSEKDDMDMLELTMLLFKTYRRKVAFASVLAMLAIICSCFLVLYYIAGILNIA